MTTATPSSRAVERYYTRQASRARRDRARRRLELARSRRSCASSSSCASSTGRRAVLAASTTAAATARSSYLDARGLRRSTTAASTLGGDGRARPRAPRGRPDGRFVADDERARAGRLHGRERHLQRQASRPTPRLDARTSLDTIERLWPAQHAWLRLQHADVLLRRRPHARRPLLRRPAALLRPLQARRFSRHVALLHDYGLCEFTILVRKEPRREAASSSSAPATSPASPHVYLRDDSPHEVVAFTVDERVPDDADSSSGSRSCRSSGCRATYPPGELPMFVAIGFSRVNQARRRRLRAVQGSWATS